MIDLKEIIQYIKTHAYHYKTDKSLYNIIVGAKTHQTYFDACSQQLLSLYHSHPNLKYPSFERIFKDSNVYNNNVSKTLKVTPRYTFESIQQTFQVIQLLTQTISNHQHQSLSFIPVSQIDKVQRKAKNLYYEILNNDEEKLFKEEIYTLFASINSYNELSILHYFLQGYEETMYTNQQVGMIELISEEELIRLKMNDLVEMMNQIENKDKFKILHKTIILPELSQNAFETYQYLKNDKTMKEISVIENVKENTIEDHVLELFIKGYLSDYHLYINQTFYSSFKSFYQNNKEERLKVFKSKFPEHSYFDIKLAIVRFSREG
ncbi:helix-turn-helix domain-containing protein [Staphylococcus carnosus]|uniref:helix-turn-helix domain-containing protein n=1 Tax=Staphylococcus carnosus TaxID=1281 RepID=UPI001F2377D2|nr:helix-turn-helix domain-containing protein [Staphylococcus carnosus]